MFENCGYEVIFKNLRVFRVYPGLPGKLPEYPKNRPGNFQVDPGIPGYPQIYNPGKKYLEYLEEEWNRQTRIMAQTERQYPRSKTDLGVPSRGKNESNTKEV